MNSTEYGETEAGRYVLQPWMLDRPAMGCENTSRELADGPPTHAAVEGVDTVGCIYQLPTNTEPYEYYLESYAYAPIIKSDTDESVAASACETIHENKVEHERSRIQTVGGEASHADLSCRIRDRFPKDVEGPSVSDEYHNPPVSPIRRTDIFTTHPSHSKSTPDPQPERWFGTRVHTVGQVVLYTHVEGATVPRDISPKELLIEYATRIELNAQRLQAESPVEELPRCFTDDDPVP